jgi:hypothetical protein
MHNCVKVTQNDFSFKIKGSRTHLKTYTSLFLTDFTGKEKNLYLVSYN